MSHIIKQIEQYEVDTIIFDLGGVLLNIDYNLTIRAFEKLGFRNFGSIFSQATQQPLVDDFETGRISEQDFFLALQDMSEEKVRLKDLEKAWNAMLLDFPRENIEMLKLAEEKYRIFLLSNTNESHVRAFNRILRSQHNLEGLEDLFDKVYFSHRIGLRKPDPQAFQLILDEQGLKTSQTLFIDDTERHIRAAAGLGLKTWHKVGTG